MINDSTLFCFQKKASLFLFTLLFPLTALAQDAKFSYRVEASLGISDRFFINDAPFPFLDKTFRDVERSRVGFDFGLLAEYRLSEHFGLLIGGKYVQWGYKSGKIRLFGGVPDPQIPEFSQQSEWNKYIEIPLRLHYYFNLGNGRMVLNGGYYPSINLSNTRQIVEFFSDRTEVTEVKDDLATYRNFNMIGEIGLGWEKDLSDLLAFYIMPHFKMQTLGIYEEGVLNRKLFYYGCSVGLKL